MSFASPDSPAPSGWVVRRTRSSNARGREVVRLESVAAIRFRPTSFVVSGPCRTMGSREPSQWCLVSPTATATPDTTCAEAVDLARAAALEDASPGTVGDHLGVEAADDRVVTHYFAPPGPAYRALDDELGATTATLDDPDVAQVVWSFGRGRERMLSRLGRDDAVDRWYVSQHGPEAPIAKSAPAACGTCGFWLPLAGALHGVFGACANEFAPDDGKLVSADHGCGAHSEAMVVSSSEPFSGPLSAPGELFEYEIVEVS